jgi:hypothetical protein
VCRLVLRLDPLRGSAAGRGGPVGDGDDGDDDDDDDEQTVSP